MDKNIVDLIIVFLRQNIKKIEFYCPSFLFKYILDTNLKHKMPNICRDLIQNAEQDNLYTISNGFFCDIVHKKKENNMVEEIVDNFSGSDQKKYNNDVYEDEWIDDTKIIKKKCIGFKSGENKEPCPFFGKNGKRTCINHRDMENYTDAMLEKIQKCSLCGGKPRWRYIIDENEGCDMCMKKLKKEKCGDNGGLMANGEKCIKGVKEGTNYCTDHKDLISYTPQMLADQKYCSSGNHVRYCGGYSTCEKCRNSAKAKRLEIKSVKDQCEKCLHCDSKIIGTGNSKYCRKHDRLENLNILTAKQNKKLCTNVIRGCRNLLEHDYKYKKCRECLDKSNTSKQIKERKSSNHNN